MRGRVAARYASLSPDWLNRGQCNGLRHPIVQIADALRAKLGASQRARHLGSRGAATIRQDRQVWVGTNSELAKPFRPSSWRRITFGGRTRRFFETSFWLLAANSTGNRLAYLVRKATVQDAAEMIRLERQSPTTTHWTEQQYLDLLAAMPESPTRLISCNCRKKARLPSPDFSSPGMSPPEWELENIVVAPAGPPAGIGKKLMDTLLVQARQTNSDAMSS